MPRRHLQGYEVGFRPEIMQRPAKVWESISTSLFRRKFKTEDAENYRANLLQNLEDSVSKASDSFPILTGKQVGLRGPRP